MKFQTTLGSNGLPNIGYGGGAGESETANAVLYNGSVNTSKAGVYTVKYFTQTTNGTWISKSVTVTVKNYTALNVKNITLPMNTSWSASKAFVSAFNASNSSVALSSVKVTGAPTMSRTGNYNITYSYGGITKTAVVTVKNYTALNVKNVTVARGSRWSNSLAFVSAYNASNTKLSLSSVRVSGSVNTGRAGTYYLTYSYSGINKRIAVTVR